MYIYIFDKKSLFQNIHLCIKLFFFHLIYHSRLSLNNFYLTLFRFKDYAFNF